MTRHEVEMIKERFQPGMRILLHEMKGEPRMYDGLEGTIESVDDIGQIHVRWDMRLDLGFAIQFQANLMRYLSQNSRY
ncbi:MAG: DUF4314 domain-containing protein [Clostridiales bacterium]|nr:DUF4314 domain-containing protein [Clostridiales bacterium]